MWPAAPQGSLRGCGQLSEGSPMYAFCPCHSVPLPHSSFPRMTLPNKASASRTISQGSWAKREVLPELAQSYRLPLCKGYRHCGHAYCQEVGKHSLSLLALMKLAKTWAPVTEEEEKMACEGGRQQAWAQVPTIPTINEACIQWARMPHLEF